ncbi:uncharacterized protein LOC122375193 [Amphibalanus amphitrite]|uniref:uncharacterized protein LOC122375193 n=1 Tax=Amphibalanus amphitrite TaxID=1232801 RepID=UPI001C920B59|nr:uncharacterized protein LOC122375193 [Amphibalanus amphitrite]
MLTQLSLKVILFSISLGTCSSADDAQVTAVQRSAAGPVGSTVTAPLERAPPPDPLPGDLRSLPLLQRRRRQDVVFWAARGKRPVPVHYWDVPVRRWLPAPAAGMTSATARRFFGLPRKRQREWEARIDNGNGSRRMAREGVPQREAAGSKLDRDGPEGDDRSKKEFWASRGKKRGGGGGEGGGGDFWASRGKKDNGNADFWATRGRRSDPDETGR